MGRKEGTPTNAHNRNTYSEEQRRWGGQKNQHMSGGKSGRVHAPPRHKGSKSGVNESIAITPKPRNIVSTSVQNDNEKDVNATTKRDSQSCPWRDWSPSSDLSSSSVA